MIIMSSLKKNNYDRSFLGGLVENFGFIQSMIGYLGVSDLRWGI